MKKLVYLFLTIIVVVGCKNRQKIETVIASSEDYFYSEKTDKLPEKFESKIGDWAKVGTECYGVLLILSDSNKIQYGTAIPCKIVSFHTNGIKCKTTTNIFPYEELGCNNMGVRKGETWLEDEGHLFRTLEEAEAHLKKQGAYIQNK